MLDKNVFNTEKSDYGKGGSLFLGQEPGLFDTVNKRFPKIWDLYKHMKQLDWDENEFNFTTCNDEFKTRPRSVTKRMIATLAWQWEQDSVAARMILPVAAPFITAPELQAAWSRVTDNEVIHAATYSEIVRYSFDDPKQVLDEVLGVKEALSRLESVSELFAEVFKVSHELALGMRQKGESETYDAAMMFAAAMFVMERIQFMASFAVTFAIGQSGMFMPIAKAVQKICQDEYEVHVQLNRAVLRNELGLDCGRDSWKRIRHRIVKLIRDVIVSEFTWVDYLESLDDEPLVGLTSKHLKDWVLYSALDVCTELGIEASEVLPPGWHFPKKTPLPFMDKWIDISKIQPAPQEQDNGQYKMNILARESEGVQFTVDF